MQTLDMALRDLVLNKKVDIQDALAKSHHPDELKRMLGLETEAKTLLIKKPPSIWRLFILQLLNENI